MFIKNDSELKPSTQELITAFDSYFAGWHRERMGCRREPWGVAVTWVIELDGREIGRVSVGPLPRGGGFRITQASTAQGIERQLYGDVMDDLEWAVKLDLGLREPGARIKRRPEPPSKTQAREQQPAIPTRPSAGATREEWFRYKLLCDGNPACRFTHKALADELGYSEGYVRQIYAEWKAGIDLRDT